MAIVKYDNYIIPNHNKELLLLIMIMDINTQIYSLMVVHG